MRTFENLIPLFEAGAITFAKHDANSITCNMPIDVDCANCSQRGLCTTSLSTITNKQLEFLKTNHPELFI